MNPNPTPIKALRIPGRQAIRELAELDTTIRIFFSEHYDGRMSFERAAIYAIMNLQAVNAELSKELGRLIIKQEKTKES